MVLPLFDDDAIGRSTRPYVTYGIICINVVAFLLTPPLDIPAGDEFLRRFGLIPNVITAEANSQVWFLSWLTLLTHQFLHMDVVHLFCNMIVLWVFGDNVEDSMGPLRFAAFYLLCGIAGGLCQTAADSHSTLPMIGASGSVSGVIAAYLFVRPCAKVGVFFMLLVLRIQAFWVAGLYVMTQVLQIASSTDDGVGYWAHLGGLAAGAGLLPLMRYPHVELFQCIGESTQVLPKPIPDTSHLPGSPQKK